MVTVAVGEAEAEAEGFSEVALGVGKAGLGESSCDRGPLKENQSTAVTAAVGTTMSGFLYHLFGLAEGSGGSGA